MEFCDQSWNFTNFAPKFDQCYMLFVIPKKLRGNLESLHFLMFPWKIKKWSWKSRGEIFCQVCGNPVNDQSLCVL